MHEHIPRTGRCTAAAVGLVACCALVVAAGAAPPDYTEIGTRDGTPRTTLEDGHGGLAPQFEVMLEARTPEDEEMDATYGLVPGVGLGVSIAPGASTRIRFRVRYLSSTGDPYHDLPGFTAPRRSRVTAVPLSLGVCQTLVPGRRVRFDGGLDLGLGLFRERIPDPDQPGDDLVYTGSGLGLSVFAGPALTLGHGRRLALEAGWSGLEADLDHGRLPDITTNLTGFFARVSLAFTLTSRKEGTS